MNYLDELEKTSVSDFITQARHRIDGLTMYFVCAIFTIFATYSALADWFDWSFPTPEWKRLGGVSLLLFVPVTFVAYISLVYYSTPGKQGRVINAIILLIIPFYFAYKLNLF